MGAALSSASDGLLAAAVARRHLVALDEGYRRHVGAVYAIARRLLNDPQAAAGVVKEVFIGFRASADEFDSKTEPLRSFLLAETYRSAVDHCESVVTARGSPPERERRRCQKRGDPSLEVEHSAVWPGPADETEAIELACFPGTSYHDIAMFLGTSEAAIKAGIRAGLRELRLNRRAKDRTPG